jgi:hypothetical protein
VLGSAPLILSVAAIATVVVYLLPVDADKYEWWSTWANFIAPAAGILVGAAVGIALAIWGKDRSSSDRANPAIHGELTRYWATLNSRVAAVCELPDGTPRDFSKVTDDLRACGTIADDQRACDTARMLRDSIGRELGLWPLESPTAPGKGARWVLGTGYVDLWTSLHDADEALFIVEPDAAVRSYGLHDEMRLKDSNVRNEDDFLSKLRRAVLVLGGGQYLSAAPPLPTVEDTEKKDPCERRLARVMLSDVRHVLNEFRDGRRAALVRGQNHLTAVGTLTGVAAYTLLALAVLVEAPIQNIIAAVFFFLVGAVVGLFQQLRLSTTGRLPTEEDFGLGRARLVYAPILSGLAAVLGVAVTAMLYASLSGPVLVYPERPASSPVGAEEGGQGADGTEGDSGDVGALPEVPDLVPPPLGRIFDLDANRSGLLIAAVFGLTPGLLVNRLQAQADRIKGDLQSTSGPETSASAAG